MSGFGVHVDRDLQSYWPKWFNLPLDLGMPGCLPDRSVL